MEVAAGEHELVADAEAAAEDRAAGRIEGLAEAGVERVDAECASVDRGEDLDVGDRVDSEMLREALGDERDDLVEGGSWVGSLDHEEVAGHPLRGGEGGWAARADGVGSADDHASGGLAEDVGELGDRDRAGLDELGEWLAGSDRRELVGVADEDHVGLGADGAEERDEELEVGHRGLVDDQEVGVELFDGRALVGDPAERGVDGRGVEAARLGHAAGGSAGWGDEQH